MCGRMLLTMKAFNEGNRALVITAQLWTRLTIPRMRRTACRGSVGVLTPLCRRSMTERVGSDQHGMQVFGGPVIFANGPGQQIAIAVSVCCMRAQRYSGSDLLGRKV